jgi:DHA1 family tetracycline resistance protein-like MFS transporter
MKIIFLIVFVDLMGFGLIVPLLPFFAEHFAASPTTVGLLMASYSLAQLVSAPLWGRLSDRTGRRPVLLWSLGGIALAYLGLALAESLWMLFVARTVAGAMAGNIAAAFAYAADVSTPATRARAMGTIGAAFGLGFMIGPAIGGALAGHDPLHANFQLPALAAAALSTTAFLLTLFVLPESLSAELRARARQGAAGPTRLAEFRRVIGRSVVAQILLVSFLATFVFAGLEAMFALWSHQHLGWGPAQNGYLFALVGTVSALVQGGLVGPLARRFGEPRLIALGAAGLGLGMLLIPLTATAWDLSVVMVLAAAGFSLLSPGLNSLLSLHVGRANLGGSMGVSRSVTTLARVVGPVCLGVVFDAMGKDWPFYAGAAIMALTVVMTSRFAAAGWQQTEAAASGEQVAD